VNSRTFAEGFRRCLKCSLLTGACSVTCKPYMNFFYSHCIFWYFVSRILCCNAFIYARLLRLLIKLSLSLSLSFYSGIDDMLYGRTSFNGVHPVGSIGEGDSYSLALSGRGGDPAMVVSTVTHEEGHGLGMRHDNKGASIHPPPRFYRFRSAMTATSQSLLFISMLAILPSRNLFVYLFISPNGSHKNIQESPANAR